MILILYRCGLFAAVDAARDAIGYHPRLSSYSQFEEDKFILDFFGKDQGVYIDVGAFHPWRISNTYLLYQRGWRGVTIEPIARLIAKHRRLRRRDIQLHAAAGQQEGQIEFNELVPAAASTFSPDVAKLMIESGHAILYKRYQVPVLSLTEIYRQTLFPQPIDLLTIDVEGFGLSVLHGIDFRVLRPQMIVVEMNNDSGDGPMREYLRLHGYEALKMFGCNEVFCRR